MRNNELLEKRRGVASQKRIFLMLLFGNENNMQIFRVSLAESLKKIKQKHNEMHENPQRKPFLAIVKRNFHSGNIAKDLYLQGNRRKKDISK